MSEYLERAKTMLDQATITAPGGDPRYMIGRALVGIGYVLLDWREQDREKGAPHGDSN
jgi:hypothetical protein